MGEARSITKKDLTRDTEAVDRLFSMLEHFQPESVLFAPKELFGVGESCLLDAEQVQPKLPTLSKMAELVCGTAPSKQQGPRPRETADSICGPGISFFTTAAMIRPTTQPNQHAVPTPEPTQNPLVNYAATRV